MLIPRELLTLTTPLTTAESDEDSCIKGGDEDIITSGFELCRQRNMTDPSIRWENPGIGYNCLDWCVSSLLLFPDDPDDCTLHLANKCYWRMSDEALAYAQDACARTGGRITIINKNGEVVYEIGDEFIERLTQN